MSLGYSSPRPVFSTTLHLNNAHALFVNQYPRTLDNQTCAQTCSITQSHRYNQYAQMVAPAFAANGSYTPYQPILQKKPYHLHDDPVQIAPHTSTGLPPNPHRLANWQRRFPVPTSKNSAR